MISINDIISENFSNSNTLTKQDFETCSTKYKYIQIHSASIKNSTKIISIEDFNNVLNQIFTKYLKRNALTEKESNYMMSKVFNYLYVDFDYYSTNENFEKENQKLAELVFDLLQKEFKPKFNLLFIPDVLTKSGCLNKCGFHINIFLDRVITYEERKELDNQVKKILTENDDILEWWDKHNETIFAHENDNTYCNLLDIYDSARFLSTDSHILPFCQKSPKARCYKLIRKNGNGNNLIIEAPENLYNKCFKPKKNNSLKFNNGQEQFSIEYLRNIHEEILSNNNSGYQELRDIPPKFISLMKRNLVQRKLMKIHGIGLTSPIIDIEMFLYDFFDGVSMMDENLPINQAFKKGAQFGEMNYYLIKLIQIWFVLYSLSISMNKKPGTIDISNNEENKTLEELEKLNNTIKSGSFDYDLIEKVPEVIYCIIMPLLIKGGKTVDEDIINNISEAVRYMGSFEYSLQNEFEDIISYNKSELNYFQKFYTPLEIYNYHHFASLDTKSKQKLKQNNWPEFNMLSEDYNLLNKKFNKVILNWSIFVKQEIFDRIKYEIEPFEPYSKKRTEDFTFMNLNNNKKFVDEYIYQLSNVNKMFVFILMMDGTINHYEEIIYQLISRYLKEYVYITRKKASIKPNEKDIYIYNVRQCFQLQKMPYNQWVLDNNNILKAWITMLYSNILKPLENNSSTLNSGDLQTIINLIYQKYKIMKIDNQQFTILSEKIKIRESGLLINKIHDYLVDYDVNTEQFIDHKAPLMDIPQKSSYVSVRNGLLHYIKNKITGKWEVEFRKNNRNIILNSYTLATYVPLEKYDFNCKEYKTLMNVISQIYPIEEEREYILNLFASIICPLIVKDQMLFLYGTGSDGKSTMNKIIENFLGHQDSIDIQVTENDNKEHQITLYNPRGYATTFKSSILTVSEQGSNHNEGGVINFDNKTFAVAQEPPQGKIHTEVFKDFLSGSVTHGRKIRQADQAFTCNLLVVLETNQIPQFDIIDNAVRRRVIVYPHQTKFKMFSTQQYLNKKYVFNADSNLINEIISDTRYWQAMLEEFVRRSLKLLNTSIVIDGKVVNGIMQISNIKMPESVKKCTDCAFGRTSGLTKWLDNALVESSAGFISIYNLINIIKRRNNQGRRKQGEVKGYILDNCSSELEVMKEIKTILQNKYEDNIFMLNLSKIIKDSKYSNKIEIDMNKVNELEQETKLWEINQLREAELIGDYSVSTIDSGKDTNLKDLILVGYDYNTEDDDIIDLLELNNDLDDEDKIDNLL